MATTLLSTATKIDNFTDQVNCPECLRTNTVYHFSEKEVHQENLSDDCKWITAETSCVGCSNVLQFSYSKDNKGNTHI